MLCFSLACHSAVCQPCHVTWHTWMWMFYRNWSRTTSVLAKRRPLLLPTLVTSIHVLLSHSHTGNCQLYFLCCLVLLFAELKTYHDGDWWWWQVSVCYLCVGTPLAGQTDDLTRLHEICRLHDVWLHLDGYDSVSSSCISVCAALWWQFDLMWLGKKTSEIHARVWAHSFAHPAI